ncbi:MAG: hypothetical protein EZS28_003104 [Streblomastix strix]|uniref:Uncharacterized protein n=1 Tax=Streblomastix strix TaxID=222440 RepID=A0A5J4X2F9_9EUKA|nr:MAG: hypothetical protein EZS28_003104 [Streblomastix strix]
MRLEQSIFESLKGRKLFGKKNDSEKNSDNIRNLISIFGKEQHNHAIIDFQKALHSLNTQSFLILLLLLIIFLGDSSSVFDPTLDARPGSTSSYTAQSPLRSSPFWVTSLSQSPFQNGTTVGGKTIIIPRLITDVTLYTNTDYGKDQRKGYSNEIGNDDSDSLDSGDKQLEAKIHDNIEEKQRYEEAFKSFTPLSAALSSYSVIPINLFVEIGIPLCVIYFTSWLGFSYYIMDVHTENSSSFSNKL